MIGAAPPVVSELTAWLVLVASCATVVSLVLRTSRKVIQWIDRQEARYEAVDVVAADWQERGLTPKGAVLEAAKYRQLADVHSAAISSHAARLDDHDERFGHVDRQLAQIKGQLAG